MLLLTKCPRDKQFWLNTSNFVEKSNKKYKFFFLLNQYYNQNTVVFVAKKAMLVNDN